MAKRIARSIGIFLTLTCCLLIRPEEMYNEAIKIPELAEQKVARYVSELGVKESDALNLTQSVEMARYFEELIAAGISPKLATTWLIVELLGRLNNGVTIETSPVGSAKMINLLKRIEDGTISGKAAKEVLDYLMENDADVDSVIEKLGLKQVSDDSAIVAIIDQI